MLSDLGSILIIIYITVRFEFIYAVAGIVALIHDVIIAFGVIAMLKYEIDTPFIAAILTILGYSINDTIVAAFLTSSIVRSTSSLFSTLYANVIPENPFPVGGLSSSISFASKSKGKSSNFVPGVLKKHTDGLSSLQSVSNPSPSL